jgi:NAD(P)H dehydrogenase (quinone)
MKFSSVDRFGSRMPTANELVGARYQGRKIAEIANKLHG